MDSEKTIKDINDVPPNCRLSIFGAGEFGRLVYQYLRVLRQDVEVTHYWDSHKSGMVDGLAIKRFNGSKGMEKSDGIVLVASESFSGEIVKDLRKAGFDNYRVFDAGLLYQLELSDIYHVPKREKNKAYIMAVQYVYRNGVLGDIAEFGTMSGHSAAFIGAAMISVEQCFRVQEKSLYLLDSFQGIPEAESEVDVNSPQVKSGEHAAGSHFCLTDNQLSQKVRRISGLPESRIKTIKGWFCDTMPTLPKETRFSMMHIDCDLYQSTLDVLDPCFKNGFISQGAILLFDDWNCNQASPHFGERRAWAEMVKKTSG